MEPSLHVSQEMVNTTLSLILNQDSYFVLIPLTVFILVLILSAFVSLKQ